MGKSKRKKNKLALLDSPKQEANESSVLNLPEKCVRMNVKAGTKMRNVLEFALKEFQNNDGILWTAAGEGVGKAISCAEIFKRKNPGLHQVTKLGSIESQKSMEQKDKDENVKIRYVAQINILLTREPIHKKNPDHQEPDDTKLFWSTSKKSLKLSKEKKRRKSNSEKPMSLAVEESEELELEIGQKRPRKEQHTEALLKKNKTEEGDNR